MSEDDDWLEAAFTRRECLTTLALGGAALAVGCAASPMPAPETARGAVPTSTITPPQTTPPPATTGAETMPSSPALAANHTAVPLPFDATKLHGLSEKLIVSHHDNNYAGAVKNLNRTEQELAKITADTPPFLVAALRDRELTFRNSKTLHEAYFSNLGGDGKRAGAIDKALAEAYGTSSRWEDQFRATCAGLGGGSGWVMLQYELDTSALRTVGSGNHTQTQATSVPLLVMDMYEHAYHIDFGAAAARYIDAFFANVKWEEVDARYARAQRAAAAWNGK